MLKKKSLRIPSVSIKSYQRIGILLAAVFGILLLFGSSLPGSRGLITPVERSYAQGSGSVFGVEANPLDESGGLHLITDTQTAWVRGPVVYWNTIETSEGTYNWANLGTVVTEIQNAASNGLEPIVVVTGTPAWAQKYAGYTCGPIESTHFSAFANFMVELITNSPLTPFNVQYWELWNEPDLGWEQAPQPTYIWAGCWGETSDTLYYGGSYYGDMLKAVYPQIKTADPQAQVLVGGLLLDCDPNQPPTGKDCTSSKFLEGILANGGANAFDGVSYHAYDYYGNVSGTYSNGNWNSSWMDSGPSLVNKGIYLKNLLNKYGAGSKYLLNTENALLCDSCNNDPTFEETKSYYLAEAYTAAIAQNLKANIWFSMLGEWGRNNGLLVLLNPSHPPLPAYYAYRFASGELDGARFVGNVTNYPGVHGYEFAKSDRHVWVLWTPDGSSRTVDFRATPLNVFDVDGDPVAFSNDQVVIGREPYYVELPATLPRLHLPLLSNNFFALNNGGFEYNQNGWQFSDNGLPASIVSSNPVNPGTGASDTAIPAGSHSALLGNPNFPCNSSGGVPIGYADIHKTITVPDAPNMQVWLDFDYVIYSQDASTSGSYDRFEVYIQDAGSPVLRFSDGNMVSAPLSCTNWRRVPGPENNRDGKETGWATGSIDLTANMGHTVTVYFQNYSRFDNYYNTYTYLDNIQLRMVAAP